VSGDIVVITVRPVAAGRTSLTFAGEAINRRTGDLMATVGRITFVALDGDRRPAAHGVTLPAAAGEQP
ncbi:MAG TPA: acyl-CoA thioesterase, partial [bacterium]|nr:acyl-CoA thioesterase [bacterium]